MKKINFEQKIDLLLDICLNSESIPREEIERRLSLLSGLRKNYFSTESRLEKSLKKIVLNKSNSEEENLKETEKSLIKNNRLRQKNQSKAIVIRGIEEILKMKQII